MITHLVCPLQKAACVTKSHALHLAFRLPPPGHHLPMGPNYDLCTTPNALPLHYIIHNLPLGQAWSLPTHTATKTTVATHKISPMSYLHSNYRNIPTFPSQSEINIFVSGVICHAVRFIFTTKSQPRSRNAAPLSRS